MLRELLAALAMGRSISCLATTTTARTSTQGVRRQRVPAGDRQVLHYTVEDHPVRLIGLDTVIPGQGRRRARAPGGSPGSRTRWDAGPDRPTVIFMHHPPFRTNIEHMDVIGLEGAEAMGRLVERHPQIERILCGHVHR